MSILVSTFHMMGAILYCGGEIYDGCKNVPRVSYNLLIISIHNL